MISIKWRERIYSQTHYTPEKKFDKTMRLNDAAHGILPSHFTDVPS